MAQFLFPFLFVPFSFVSVNYFEGVYHTGSVLPYDERCSKADQ